MLQTERVDRPAKASSSIPKGFSNIGSMQSLQVCRIAAAPLKYQSHGASLYSAGSSLPLHSPKPTM